VFVEAFRDLVDICAVDVRRKDRAPERSFRRHVNFESKPLKFVSNLLFGFAGARGPAGDHISRMRVGVDICRPLRKRITANILLCLEGHIRCLSSADLQVVVKPLPFVCLILFEMTT